MPDQTPPEDLTPAALKKLKRDELNDIAADAGVPDAEDLASKDEVIAAIPNPALEPEPEPDPGEVPWKVIGPRRVHDTNPGDTFRMRPSPQTALLVESGHIERLTTED